MAVADGKITCIGKMAHVLLDCGGSQQGAETISLEEHFVMPGFNDAHVHLGGAGSDALAVQLRGVASPEEMQKRVAEAVTPQAGSSIAPRDNSAARCASVTPLTPVISRPA